MRSSLMFLALIMTAALVLVAPAGASGGRDLHRGEAFHPVFDHPHPDVPAERDGPDVAPSGGAEVHATHVLQPSGPPSAAGQVLPRQAALPDLAQVVTRLVGLSPAEPDGTGSAPPDPPPNLA